MWDKEHSENIRPIFTENNLPLTISLFLGLGVWENIEGNSICDFMCHTCHCVNVISIINVAIFVKTRGGGMGEEIDQHLLR